VKELGEPETEISTLAAEVNASPLEVRSCTLNVEVDELSCGTTLGLEVKRETVALGALASTARVRLVVTEPPGLLAVTV
jgi:hypothetical protein